MEYCNAWLEGYLGRLLTFILRSRVFLRSHMCKRHKALVVILQVADSLIIKPYAKQYCGMIHRKKNSMCSRVPIITCAGK